MRSRSRMAARWIVLLTLTAATATASAAPGDPPPSVHNTVKLDLQVSGIPLDGCEIEIRPAHPGSRFEPVVRQIERVSADGVARLDTIAIDARSLGADGDCAFAITIKAPDRADETFKRSVRLLPPADDAPVPVRSLTCYLRTVAVAKKGTPK